MREHLQGQEITGSPVQPKGPRTELSPYGGFVVRRYLTRDRATASLTVPMLLGDPQCRTDGPPTQRSWTVQGRGFGQLQRFPRQRPQRSARGPGWGTQGASPAHS